MYAPNISARKFIKQMLLSIKEQIGPDTIIAEDLNTLLYTTPFLHTTSNKKIKAFLELNNTMDEMDLTDIYKIFYPTATDYIFFSVAHGTFFKTDHILGHKTNLNKYKKKLK
jgi:hypothetical protein